MLSMPDTDTTFREEKRIFQAYDKETFKQTILEFNSYILPCYSRIHLFDKEKFYKFRNYLMMKSNFNPRGKKDNYYKFFLLLHLIICLISKYNYRLAL